jgi:hypothetical protein
MVRAFAADTQEYVTRHITYLETTGLVNYSALPEQQSPGLLSGAANWTDLLVPGLVLIACLLAATLIGASLRGRGKANKAAKLPPMVTTSAPRVATAAALIALPEAASTARSASTARQARFTSTDMAPGMSPGTPPDGILDVPTPAAGIPRSRITDSGRHSVRR